MPNRPPKTNVQPIRKAPTAEDWQRHADSVAAASRESKSLIGRINDCLNMVTGCHGMVPDTRERLRHKLKDAFYEANASYNECRRELANLAENKVYPKPDLSVVHVNEEPPVPLPSQDPLNSQEQTEEVDPGPDMPETSAPDSPEPEIECNSTPS